jgi:hypothetical protein
MAYRLDDPYNTGINTIGTDLGLSNINQANNIELAKNLNINALKENPMFQEEFVPEKAGMTDFTYGAALKKIPEGISKYDLLKGVTEGTWGLGGGEVLEKNIGGIFPKGTFKGDWNTIGDADINLKQVPGSFKYNIDVDTENIKGKVLEDLEKKGWFDSDDQAMAPGTYDPKTGIPYTASLGLKQALDLYRKYKLAKKAKEFITKTKKTPTTTTTITTAKGPPSITKVKKHKTPGGGGYGPHTKTKTKWTPPQQTGGGGGIHGGGGRPSKSGRSGFTNPGKGSYGPHKADGGLINFFKNGGFLG